MNPKELRSELYSRCLEFADQRIAHIRQAMNTASESVSDDTKSSAGDKHETGRAMAQLEQEKMSKQLTDAMQMKNDLLRLENKPSTPRIGPGSLVVTNKGNFYISVPAGKILLNNEQWYAISGISPLGTVLVNRSQNETVVFNGQSYQIKSVY
jgi:hypothetical protein